jgi:hypothetical protein
LPGPIPSRFSLTTASDPGFSLSGSDSCRSLHKEAEVALCTAGIGLDYGGPQYDRIPPDEMKSILAAFPRLDMKRCFTDSVCRIVRIKPETTYDNFARDFGERFVPDYKASSSVDFLMTAPFEE